MYIFASLFFPDTSHFLPFYNSDTEQLIQYPFKIYRAHKSFYKTSLIFGDSPVTLGAE